MNSRPIGLTDPLGWGYVIKIEPEPAPTPPIGWPEPVPFPPDPWPEPAPAPPWPWPMPSPTPSPAPPPKPPVSAGVDIVCVCSDYSDVPGIHPTHEVTVKCPGLVSTCCKNACSGPLSSWSGEWRSSAGPSDDDFWGYAWSCLKDCGKSEERGKCATAVVAGTAACRFVRGNAALFAVCMDAVAAEAVGCYAATYRCNRP